MGDTQQNESSTTTLDGYQTRAINTATYPGRGEYQIIYPVIAMAEEAGELASAVLKLIEKRDSEAVEAGLRKKAPGVPHEHFVAEASLRLAAASGAVLGLIKKAYRNDPAGELTKERIGQIERTLLSVSFAVQDVKISILSTKQFQFPPVPVVGDDQVHLVKEVGDVLWYVAAFCTEARVSLGCVGDANYAKLEDRKRRGVIRDTGDDR